VRLFSRRAELLPHLAPRQAEGSDESTVCLSHDADLKTAALSSIVNTCPPRTLALWKSGSSQVSAERKCSFFDTRNPRKVRNNAANPCETTRYDTRKMPFPRPGHRWPKAAKPCESNALCRIEPVWPQPAGGLGRRTIRVDPVSGRRLCDATLCQAKACREKPPIPSAPFYRRDEKPCLSVRRTGGLLTCGVRKRTSSYVTSSKPGPQTPR